MGRLKRYLVPFVLLAPLRVCAHGTGLLADGPRWWLGGLRSIGSVAAVVAAGVVFGVGYFRAPQPRTARSPKPRLYWSGWLALAVALVSPVHPLGDVLFSAHMAQHELLMIVAAPLIVLGRPGAAYFRAVPAAWRPAVGRGLHAISPARRSLLRPLPAGLIHAAALWVWHLPILFEAALAHPLAHAAQHASFFLSALLFWDSVFFPVGGRQARGGAIVSVFATALHTTVLGALLTCSGRIWYPHYAATTEAWGYAPLEDQQLGGLIMWVPAGVVYLAAGLALFSQWMRESAAGLPRHPLRIAP